jgi:zinc protease
MRPTITTLSLALALCAGPVAAAAGQQPAGQPAEQAKQQPPAGGAPKAFVLPKRDTFKLPNGVEVTLVPYGAIPKVAVTTIIRTGSVDEPAEKVWLADLTGNMLKEGTSARSAAQIAQQSAEMGGSVNVNVGPDTTTITGDVLSEFGPQLAALVAEIVQRPALPESELTRLKANMQRQLSIARTQPGPLANERFRQVLYPNHPYGRIFPTEASINALTIDDVRKFYGENFGAARTRVYVAGRFDAEAMRKAVTDAFGKWERGTPAATNVPKPVAARSLHLIDRPGAAQSTLYVGLPAIDPSNKDWIAFQVMNALLGGSFGSRITSNIREQKGYTYSPSSQVSVRYRDAYWVEVADVTTAVTGPSLKEIFHEIDRLRTEPPSEAELQGIKNYLAGIFVLQNSSRQGVIGQLAFADLHGLPADYLSTYVQRVLAVTPKDVQRIAEQYISPDRMAIVVVGDRAKVAEQLAPYGKISEN